MKVIGLTGGIGSGKSTVSQLLADLGAFILDADTVGHEVLRRDTEVWQEVVSAFGREILTPTDDIDRKKLGEMVFNSPQLLTRLNQIMHPRMYDMVKVQLGEYRRQGVELVVLEAPLLLEADWSSLVDEVWVTVAPEAMVLKRLQKRGGLSREKSLVRIRSQLSSEERAKRADVVIKTDCSLDELKAKVKKLWDNLQHHGTGET